MKTLVLYRATFPFLIEFLDDFEETAQNALIMLKETGEFEPGDRIIVMHEIVNQGKLVPSIQVREIFA